MLQFVSVFKYANPREFKDDNRATISGQTFLQLVVPKSRRNHVLKMVHDTFGGHVHMSVKSRLTKTLISYAFYWPTLNEDCRNFSLSPESSWDLS